MITLINISVFMCRMFFKYFYLIFFRVIGQAANCIERSLGMKFSMESLKVPSLNEEGMLLISHLTFSFFWTVFKSLGIYF